MRILLFVALSGLTSLSFANQQAMQQLNKLTADPVAQELAYTAGHERITLCQHCHGEDGNSKRDYIPNLAEQNPIYLFNSFEKFATGERKDFVMSKLAKILSLDDRVNIALYYGQQKVVTKPTNNQHLHERGQHIFEKTCQGCHGANGEGKQDMPRLAGQPAEYLTRTLKVFRSKDPSRTASVMFGITANMSDEDMQSVASYLQELDF
ncbi:MAG TPA: c-type cytochrome [Gammaproteobacteria bacterium]|nr:c-type cytochrome [Gammaproteobacteria bacterium]